MFPEHRACVRCHAPAPARPLNQRPCRTIASFRAACCWVLTPLPCSHSLCSRSQRVVVRRPSDPLAQLPWVRGHVRRHRHLSADVDRIASSAELGRPAAHLRALSGGRLLDLRHLPQPAARSALNGAALADRIRMSRHGARRAASPRQRFSRCVFLVRMPMHSGVLRKRASSHFSSMHTASAMNTRLPHASRADVGSAS